MLFFYDIKWGKFSGLHAFYNSDCFLNRTIQIYYVYTFRLSQLNYSNMQQYCLQDMYYHSLETFLLVYDIYE